MFLNNELPYDPNQAIEKQWLMVNDNNNGSYAAGIDIQLPNLGSQYVPLNEMRLTGSIEVTGIGAALTAADRFIFPFGVEDIIYAVQMKTDNGVDLLTDVDNPLSNFSEWSTQTVNDLPLEPPPA